MRDSQALARLDVSLQVNKVAYRLVKYRTNLATVEVLISLGLLWRPWFCSTGNDPDELKTIYS